MSDNFFIGIIVAAVLALLIGLNFLVAEIPSEGRALDAARNIGLENVKVESRGPAFEVLGGCHKDDVTKFRVSGTTGDGTRRTITVCAPLIGGYTVRS